MIVLISTVYVYLITQMMFVWVLYKGLKNPSIVDVSWSIGLIVSGCIYLWCQSPNNVRVYFITILLLIWGLRLAGYLFITRILPGHIDKRYIALSEQWKIAKSLGFFLNFQLQGLLILILSTPFLFAGMYSPTHLVFWDDVAIILILIGIVGETIADSQLHQYQSHPIEPVCNIGLWYYSRHPNYFFEWVVWCGFTCFAFQSIYGCISLISPLVLYLIMTKFTGPMTERGSIQSRGQAYIDYMERTPMFFPWRQ